MSGCCCVRGAHFGDSVDGNEGGDAGGGGALHAGSGDTVAGLTNSWKLDISDGGVPAAGVQGRDACDVLDWHVMLVRPGFKASDTTDSSGMSSCRAPGRRNPA